MRSRPLKKILTIGTVAACLLLIDPVAKEADAHWRYRGWGRGRPFVGVSLGYRPVSYYRSVGYYPGYRYVAPTYYHAPVYHAPVYYSPGYYAPPVYYGAPVYGYPAYGSGLNFYFRF